MHTIFFEAWGRDSYDNDGTLLEVYVHATIPGGARWNGECQIFEFSNGYVGQDIMVHEFTHAVISKTSKLVYSGQSGALNESFADIMAAAEDGNWLFGEVNTSQAAPERDLSDPPVYGQPDSMSNYQDMVGDNGGVHTNSGIHNKVAYLLAVGGTHNGFTIQPLEGNSAQKETVLMLNTMYNVPSDAQFVHAR